MSKKPARTVKRTPRRSVAKSPCKYCEKATTGNKDFCIDHIDQSPYAKRLLDTMAKIEKEVNSVSRRGARAIKVDSPMVIAILEELRIKKKMTIKKLAQTVDVSQKTLRKYLNYLVKRKKVVVGSTRRKDADTVELA